MQVSVEQTSELSRKMTVQISEEALQEKVDARLKSLKSEVKIDGFRPGKIPLSLIKKRYGEKVRGEIAGELVQSSYYEALQEQELRPVNMPHIHPIKQEIGIGYTAEFEIYPEISLEGISNIEAKRPISSIETADFDEMVEKLRKHKVLWESVERHSEDNDRVTIHFSGTAEGEDFTDGKVENFEVELGQNQMIPGFEAQLLNLEVGAHKSFELTFPETYAGNPKLNGKVANFEVDVIKVEAPNLPEVDEDFVKEYGIETGDVDAFYEDVRANMKNELQRALSGELKEYVLDALYESLKITLPKALVDQEISTMMKPYIEAMKKQGQKPEEMDLPHDIFEERAKKRVGLGLILAEIIQEHKISVDNEKLRTTVQEITENYDNPEEALVWYYEDEKRLEDVKQMVLEEQTVEWLTGQMTMSDEAPQKFHDLVSKRLQKQQQR
ncbi:MAG: trigger factor, partial [Methylococcales bacterium]|nr:trigger factor [Methylococcales bacterium]